MKEVPFERYAERYSPDLAYDVRCECGSAVHLFEDEPSVCLKCGRGYVLRWRIEQYEADETPAEWKESTVALEKADRRFYTKYRLAPSSRAEEADLNLKEYKK